MLRFRSTAFLVGAALAASPLLLGNNDCSSGGGGQTCGGIEGVECPSTHYCDYDLDTPDGTGVCRRLPTEVCPEIWAPVCGVDGRTYSSDCHAHAAGVTVSYEGECMSEGCPEPAPGAPNVIC